MTEQQALIILLEAEERMASVQQYMLDLGWEPVSNGLIRLLKQSRLIRRQIEKFMRD
jgi:hypothetical protein